MERFGLVDKTKEELIDIALEQEVKGKELREELNSINTKLARTKNELKKRNESISMLCFVCMLMMASIVVLLMNR